MSNQAWVFDSDPRQTRQTCEGERMLAHVLPTRPERQTPNPSRARILIGLCLASVLLYGCNHQSDASTGKSDAVPTGKPLSQKEVTNRRESQVDPSYSRLPAPKGWRHWQAREGKRSFRVSFPGDYKQRAVAFGVIATDRSLETLIKKSMYSPKYIENAHKAYADVEPRFPDFAGFTKFIDAGPLRHRIADGEEIFGISYLSEEPKIYCYGQNHETFRCLWGSSSERHQLIFDYQDILVAMPYVHSLAEESE